MAYFSETFPIVMYSTLADFVESAEKSEVKEETGIAVRALEVNRAPISPFAHAYPASPRRTCLEK
jgi:NADH pyrophosphatase NudC (nudix superfamily)